MRDRLIELLKKVPYGVGVGAKFEQHFCEKVADCLLENGVVVPPVKIGATVYYITGITGKIIKPATVEEIYIGEDGFAYHVCSGLTWFILQQEEVYLTKEQAEKALVEVANGTR